MRHVDPMGKELLELKESYISTANGRVFHGTKVTQEEKNSTDGRTKKATQGGGRKGGERLPR